MTHFLIEKRPDGFYAVFIDKSEIGPYPCEDSLMREVIATMLKVLESKMGDIYTCPQCGTEFKRVNGYIKEIFRAQVHFCTEVCAYKNPTFQKTWQTVMI